MPTRLAIRSYLHLYKSFSLKRVANPKSISQISLSTCCCRSFTSLSLSQWLINSANCLASRRIAHHFSLHTPTLPTSSYLCLSNPTLEVPLWQSDLSHEVTPDLSTANNTSHPRSWVGLSDSPIYMVKVTTIFSLINDIYLLVVLIDRIYWIVNWFCWNLFCL
jgi:hypothetical protein